MLILPDAAVSATGNGRRLRLNSECDREADPADLGTKATGNVEPFDLALD